MERRYYNVDEIASYLGVSPKNIYFWVNKREIPFCKLGKRLKFDIKRIEQWMGNKSIGVN